jgi:hypothetical protein
MNPIELKPGDLISVRRIDGDYAFHELFCVSPRSNSDDPEFLDMFEVSCKELFTVVSVLSADDSFGTRLIWIEVLSSKRLGWLVCEKNETCLAIERLA